MGKKRPQPALASLLFCLMLCHGTLTRSEVYHAEYEADISGQWLRADPPPYPSTYSGMLLNPGGNLQLQQINTLQGLSWYVEGQYLILNVYRHGQQHPSQLRLPILELDDEHMLLGGQSREFSATFVRGHDFHVAVSAQIPEQLEMSPLAQVFATLEKIRNGHQVWLAEQWQAVRRDEPVSLTLHYTPDRLQEGEQYLLTMQLMDHGRLLAQAGSSGIVRGGRIAPLQLTLQPVP